MTHFQFIGYPRLNLHSNIQRRVKLNCWRELHDLITYEVLQVLSLSLCMSTVLSAPVSKQIITIGIKKTTSPLLLLVTKLIVVWSVHCWQP